MSEFVVSARKYRPADFASVVGQRHITDTLKNAIARGQLAHAYLFCGPRGVGKTTCARIFAKAINCAAGQSGEACNACPSCRNFDAGQSLNIHELDAASNNSVEDIRQLIEQVRILPQEGRYSVFIIDEVHMLSQAAFNAFLKTLEEPPAHAIFILATTEKHKILPTILSRCQIYDFNRIRVEDAVGYLRHIADKEGVEADDESLNLIGQKADGAMRDALSMLDKAVSFCGGKLRYAEVAQTLNVLDYDTYFQAVSLLLDGDYKAVLLLLDEVMARGFSAQTFMAGLSRHLRDLLVARDEQTARLLEFTGSLTARYREQAAAAPPEFLFEAIAILTDADGRIRLSSNQRLLVELSLMKIAGLGQKKNNPDARLERGLPLLPEAPEEPVVEEKPAAEEEPAADLEKPVEEPVVVEAAPEPVKRPASRLGLSISELLKPEVAEPEAGKVEAPIVDPESEAKLEAARTRILELIAEKRPRFVPAFGEVRFVGPALHLEVPSQELKEEILRQKTAMLTRIAALAGVNGKLELEVSVNEQMKAARPIKSEDKARFLTEKNPLLSDLRRVLDLEIE